MTVRIQYVEIFNFRYGVIQFWVREVRWADENKPISGARLRPTGAVTMTARRWRPLYRHEAIADTLFSDYGGEYRATLVSTLFHTYKDLQWSSVTESQTTSANFFQSELQNMWSWIWSRTTTKRLQDLTMWSSPWGWLSIGFASSCLMSLRHILRAHLDRFAWRREAWGVRPVETVLWKYIVL